MSHPAYLRVSLSFDTVNRPGNYSLHVALTLLLLGVACDASSGHGAGPAAGHQQRKLMYRPEAQSLQEGLLSEDLPMDKHKGYSASGQKRADHVPTACLCVLGTFDPHVSWSL